MNELDKDECKDREKDENSVRESEEQMKVWKMNELFT